MMKLWYMEFGRIFGTTGEGFPSEIGRILDFLDLVPLGELVLGYGGRVASEWEES